LEKPRRFRTEGGLNEHLGRHESGTGPEYAAVATAIYGLPTIWLASFFLKERINLKQWGGCFIVFIGIGYLAL
jgi:drug/metabolite transporter (DMT)-like permease